MLIRKLLSIFICYSTFCYSQDSVATKMKSAQNLLKIEKQFFNKDVDQKLLDMEMYKNIEFLNSTQLNIVNNNESLINAKILSYITFGENVDIHEVSSKESLNITDSEKRSNRLYGPSQYDSRIEPLQLNKDIDWQNKILYSAESVAVIIEKEKLTRISKDIYQIDISQKLGTFYNLCGAEAFLEQPVAGIGSAFISGGNRVLTALHVLERPLRHYAIIFSYKVLFQNNAVNVLVGKDDIYFPSTFFRKNDDFDFAELTVDRNFNRPILEWENSKEIKKESSEIYMLGYPSGLPLKLAINASILENDHPLYYYTSLDSFQGNSGSPVFNFKTNKVIGLLVSGELDYKFNGNCNYTPLCKYPYCKGEKVMRIEEIMR